MKPKQHLALLAALFLLATATHAAPYNLIGSYERVTVADPHADYFGVLHSLSFKAGAAQGCPGPTYKQPCYKPTEPWTAANGVAAAVGAGAPTWQWDGTTLTETGLFWAASFIYSNPNGPPWLSDKVANLVITTGGAGSTNAAAYECVEGTVFLTLYWNGCKSINLNSASTATNGYTGNLVDDSSVAYNVLANPKCVTLTIGGDDYSLLDGSVGPNGGPPVAGTPNPRGLTARTAGQAGIGCAQTSGALDLWHVVRDDGTYLILANATNIGTCWIFGMAELSGCLNEPALAGVRYMLLATATAPDTDSDGNLDGFDNCPTMANANQADGNGNGIGNICDGPDSDADGIADMGDNCPSVANANQADTDGDGRGNACDNCRLVANNSGATAQCDSDNDGFGNRCDGDFGNPAPGNGVTNSQDYVIFRGQLAQPSVPPTYNKADLNCSGAVNSQDYLLFRGWLASPPGPGAGP